MNYYTQTVTGVERSIRLFIEDLIDTSGKDSDHVNSKVLKVKSLNNEDLHFNLNGGRYLTEIAVNEILDNQGYSYNHDVLTLEQWAQLADAFKSKCGKTLTRDEVKQTLENLVHKRFTLASLNAHLSQAFDTSINLEDVNYEDNETYDWNFIANLDAHGVFCDFDIYYLKMRLSNDDAEFMVTEIGTAFE